MQKNITNRIVIDTNVLVALLDSRDVHHQRAVSLVRRLQQSDFSEAIMDCIVNEVYTVFARRCLERGRSFSDITRAIKQKLESLETIAAYSMVDRYHARIIDLMITTNGLLNYHDALICLTMKSKKLHQIATFDRDFENVSWLTILAS